MTNRETILEAAKTQTLLSGTTKISLMDIAKRASCTLEELKAHFKRPEEVHRAIWNDFFDRVIKAVKSEAVYAEYLSRQKLLSFYYHFIEMVSTDRGYIKLCRKSKEFYELYPSYMEDFLERFENFVKNIVLEGKAEGEIESRKFVDDYYAQPHRAQFLWIMKVWLEDTSKDFQHTDEAIEKAVNLGFDFLERNIVDGIVDFTRFVFKSK